MAHHQQNHHHSSSALQSLLKMFRFDNSASLVAPPEDEANGEADEPPDGIPPLERSNTLNHIGEYRPAKAVMPQFDRRESLLTRALVHSPLMTAQTSPTSPIPRGTASFSTHSTASTAELTSDGDMTSPARTATPSPPFPPARLPTLNGLEKAVVPSNVVIAPSSTDQLPSTPDLQESRVEANLGRRRCVMFACGCKNSPPPEPKKEEALQDPPKRKSMLTFACPTKAAKGGPSRPSESSKPKDEPADHNKLPISPTISRSSTISSLALSHSDEATKDNSDDSGNASPAHTFHEFGSSHDEDDWVRQPTEHKQKLTFTDCMKKEMAIRKIGEEAEEEAKEDESEDDEDDDVDEGENEDDFAPSDASSTDGNESDDEGGFAESDDESDDGSEYQFWAPSTITAATSAEHLDEVRPHAFRRKSNSSIDSTAAEDDHPWRLSPPKFSRRNRPIKAPKIRPSTPDLPDSTDFVCGTLDEDRPLEAAYISCMEQKKRAKQIVLPQDIDPSFPTTDPEDAEDNDDEGENDADDLDEHTWIGGRMEGFDEDATRGRHKSTVATKKSPAHSPKRMRSPPPPRRLHSPPPTKRILSPPPAKRLRSPTKKLFSQSPQRTKSPPPLKLRSPPATRRVSPVGTPAPHVPIGITINRLAQRPSMTRTASLPHTPNPYFFRNHKDSGHQSTAILAESDEENSSRERHVRGAVDIVIGLEKKRQKRKEKFWRQHCRKAAKEQAEKKPVKGKGLLRMKELGLESAERNRGYGLGQQAQHVLSL